VTLLCPPVVRLPERGSSVPAPDGSRGKPVAHGAGFGATGRFDRRGPARGDRTGGSGPRHPPNSRPPRPRITGCAAQRRVITTCYRAVTPPRNVCSTSHQHLGSVVRRQCIGEHVEGGSGGHGYGRDRDVGGGGPGGAAAGHQFRSRVQNRPDTRAEEATVRTGPIVQVAAVSAGGDPERPVFADGPRRGSIALARIIGTAADPALWWLPGSAARPGCAAPQVITTCYRAVTPP